MAKTTIFHNNRTQAVRIPKALALPDHVKNVEIIAVGNTLLICPEGQKWDSFFDSDPAPEDFMTVREQPEAQEREGF